MSSRPSSRSEMASARASRPMKVPTVSGKGIPEDRRNMRTRFRPLRSVRVLAFMVDVLPEKDSSSRGALLVFRHQPIPAWWRAP